MFIIASPLSVSSNLLHNPKTTNLEVFFAQRFNIQIADHDLINKFVIQKLNQYTALNANDYQLWNCIEMNFEKFEAKYFNDIDSFT